MDPLVFSILTASSAPGSGASNGTNTISEHPGDTAPPLQLIEWLDAFDEMLNITSYGAVRNGDIPAPLLRATGSVSLDTMPAITQGEGITHADVARREKERALTIAENTRKRWWSARRHVARLQEPDCGYTAEGVSRSIMRG